ncbi:MAG: hypothetical protein KJ621_01095 [Proteobacteria bacterium]|nr:hypothetical protein [Pseudomonadota bacterium]MBU1740011.1 hypothetical protein [Pseudomonadota bacterium]
MSKRLMVFLAALALLLVPLAATASSVGPKNETPDVGPVRDRDGVVAQAPCVRVKTCVARKVCRPVCAKVCWDDYSFTKSCFSPRQCAPMSRCVMIGPCGVMVIKHRQCAKCCRKACFTRLKCRVRCLPERRR